MKSKVEIRIPKCTCENSPVPCFRCLVKSVLQNVVNDFETRGCEGCGTISIEAHEKVLALLKEMQPKEKVPRRSKGVIPGATVPGGPDTTLRRGRWKAVEPYRLKIENAQIDNHRFTYKKRKGCRISPDSDYNNGPSMVRIWRGPLVPWGTIVTVTHEWDDEL